MDSDLARTVRALADREAIARIIHTYCECFDRNDPDGVAALFTPDAVIDYNPETPSISGTDLRDVIADGLRETFAATSHHVSNLMIDLEEPDRARSLCYLDAWHRYHDGSPDGYLWGRYRHRLVRTADGWRITELVLEAAGTIDFHRPRMHGIGRA
jgi:ketosteroid isomerase-like protein